MYIRYVMMHHRPKKPVSTQLIYRHKIMKKALFLDLLAAAIIAGALTIGALAYFDVLVK